MWALKLHESKMRRSQSALLHMKHRKKSRALTEARMVLSDKNSCHKAHDVKCQGATGRQYQQHIVVG